MLFFRIDNTYDVDTLKEWFDKQTDVIGTMFDKRNGNESMSGEKRELLGL